MENGIYHDISTRTGGDIYIGVVGPVRTGKSTFIKRFMELAVLPAMEDESLKAVSTDELPQSAGGKTVMTTEPKFIPKEAAKLSLGDGVEVRVRLIDCVGFMVEGADVERIIAGRKVGEKQPVVMAVVIPLAVEPLEVIQVRIVAAVDIVQRHDRKTESPLPVGKHQFALAHQLRNAVIRAVDGHIPKPHPIHYRIAVYSLQLIL